MSRVEDEPGEQGPLCESDDGLDKEGAWFVGSSMQQKRDYQDEEELEYEPSLPEQDPPLDPQGEDALLLPGFPFPTVRPRSQLICCLRGRYQTMGQPR